MRIRRFFRKYILPLIMSLALTSCFSDFEPDINSVPVLCMSSRISDGDSIRLALTRTWRWDEGSPDNDPSMDLCVYDADVKLFVNGEYQETLSMRETRRNVWVGQDYPWDAVKMEYVAKYIPKSGDRIRLEAESKKYGSAWGETVVPETVVIKNVETHVLNLRKDETFDAWSFRCDLNLSVWFTDPAETVNYYQFDIEGWWMSFIDDTEEPLFTEHVSSLDKVIGYTGGYTVFSDRQISGKSYPLHIKLSEVWFRVEKYNDERRPVLNLILSSISPSYYRHVISVWAQNDGISGILGEAGLGDPVFAASNVSTGAGVIAGVSSYVLELDAEKLVERQEK